jgi:hypothetical protein
MSGVKLKHFPVFPRQVISGAGIDVGKNNGNFTISLDYAEFGLHSPYVPQPSHRVVIFAQGTSGYFTVPTTVLVAGPPDTAWSNVKLLMGADGANGATTTADESPAAHGNAFFVGGATVLDTSQFKFGVSSVVFGSAGLGQAVQWPSSADWNLGSGLFTFECWIYPKTVSTGGSYIFCRWDTTGTSSYVLLQVNNTLRWTTSTTGSDINSDITTAAVLTINTWTAVAIDFDGLKYRLYVNGVMVGSFSTPRTLFNLTNNISIGGSSAAVPSNTFFGNIDEFRFTKGVARYASDSGYTVQTAAFPRHG